MQPEKFSEDEFMAEKWRWRCFKRTVVSKKKKKKITLKEVVELFHDTCKK